MATKNPNGQSFEAALESLAQLVEQLESGDLPLEDSLAAFEKGVALVKYCNQKLSEVEKKIELLTRDKDGKLHITALAPAMVSDED